MYLFNYDFDDLYALIVYFRSCTAEFPKYIKALEQIVSYVEAPMANNVELSSVRKILRPYINEEEEEILSWVLVENVYTAHIHIVKNEIYYRMLSAIFKEMIQCANDKQRLWLLCDATHNIPLVLVDLKKPKKAIKSMIKYYQKEYNKNFLIEELKGM